VTGPDRKPWISSTQSFPTPYQGLEYVYVFEWFVHYSRKNSIGLADGIIAQLGQCSR
jgi:hypothetical protein